MEDFLSRIASLLLTNHPADLRDVWVVLPGRRAGIFLKDEIRKRRKSALWMPRILGIDDFLHLHAPLSKADKLQQLFGFYEVYKTVVPNPEDIDQFLTWATTLISDFDDTDRYLVPADQLFRNLQSVRELEDWPLDEWSFDQSQLNPMQQRFSDFWETIPSLYEGLNQTLADQGLARSGYIYRYIAENPDTVFETPQFKQVYFCGLNAVSPSETKIMKYLSDAGLAQVFWDIEPSLLADPIHEAGHFIRRNIRQVGSLPENDSPLNAPEIHIYAAPSFYSQALIATSLLKPDDDRHTAVILCDEELLEPIEEHLPALINPINITTEFPIRKTSVYNFFRIVLQLNIKRLRSGSRSIYYKDLFSIIQHPAFALLVSEEFDSGSMVMQINKQNFIYLDPGAKESVLGAVGSIVEKLYFSCTDLSDVNGFINACRQRVAEMLPKLKPGQTLLNEQLFHFTAVINQLDEIFASVSTETTLKTLLTLMKNVISEHNLSYKGEPLTGLQIMGMLETRSLNFERIIFVGANEGSLPQTGQFKSFIPYDLRMYFKMPGKKNKEAIHAYYFYRQLWRSKEVHIVFNSDTTGIDPGEPSRYIHQLHYEGAYGNITYHKPGLSAGSVIQPVSVNKDVYVVELIKKYFAEGLSPSAISKYLNCPVDFFHRYILRLGEKEEAEEDIKDSTFGSILHDVLEQFYLPAVGSGPLTEQFYHNYDQKIAELLQDGFDRTFGADRYSRGRNKLVFNVSYHYLESFLKEELKLIRAGDQLEILALEEKLSYDLEFDGLSCTIKGTIDRIDRYQGSIRILDYKTGSVQTITATEPEIAFSDQAKSKELQLMIYAWLYARNRDEQAFNAGIVYLRDPGKTHYYRSALTFEAIETIETELLNVVRDIYNPQVPFEETVSPKYPTLLGYQQ